MKKNLITTLLVLLIMCLVAIPAYAQNAELNSIVFDVDGIWVEVDLYEYAVSAAIGDGDQLYNYLKGKGIKPAIVALSGGDKYMDLIDYATNYATSDGSTAAAISSTTELPAEQTNTIQKLVAFDNQGNPILEPLVPENLELTAQDLNVNITNILPGVVNVEIPMDMARQKLNADETSLLIIEINEKPSLELAYNNKIFGGLGGFFIPAVQGYNQDEIKSGKVRLKDENKMPPTVTSLDAVITPLLPGIYNVEIPLHTAQSQLGADQNSTLILHLEDSSLGVALELSYDKDILTGSGGFLAPAVNLPESEISQALVSLKLNIKEL